MVVYKDIMDIARVHCHGDLVPKQSPPWNTARQRILRAKGRSGCGTSSTASPCTIQSRSSRPCPITAADVGGLSVRPRKSASQSCFCRRVPPGSPAGRRTISPIAPFKRAVGENDQKSFDVAWPSDSPVTPNRAGSARPSRRVDLSRLL
jgi:hypothetical protein